MFRRKYRSFNWQLNVVLLFVAVLLLAQPLTNIIHADDPIQTNPCVNDVQAAFDRINPYGSRLAANKGFYIDNQYEGLASHQKNHFQGIVRLYSNEPNFIVTAGDNGKPGVTNPIANRDPMKGPDIISIQMGSRAPLSSLWRSNVLDQSLGNTPAEPDVADRIIDVTDYYGDTEYWHAGSPSVLGNIMVVPLESDNESKIVFYDVSDPADIFPIGNPIIRNTNYIHHNNGQSITGTHKAGVAFMTPLSDGRYLVGAWSDRDNRGRRMDVYISENPGTLSFAMDLATGNTVQNFSWFVPDNFPTNASPNFPEEFPDYQSIQVVTECGNQDSFYLIAFRNTLNAESVYNSIESVIADNIKDQIELLLGDYYPAEILDPLVDDAADLVIEEMFEALGLDNQINEIGRIGVGDDYADLYRVNFTQNNINVTLLREKHMFCEGTLFPIDIDINPGVTIDFPDDQQLTISVYLGNLFPADGYCTFAAGGGVFINSSENITLYAVDQYLRDGDERNEDIRFQEFRPVSPYTIGTVEQSWVQPIWQRGQILQFFPGVSSFVIDYDDHKDRNYYDYKSINRWFTEDNDDAISFNDHVTGASWLIPDGYQYLFYEHDHQRGQYFPLVGTGQWVISPTIDIGFGVSSSGTSTHTHPLSGTLPIGGKSAFLPMTIENLDQAWIELYEHSNFDGNRLLIKPALLETAAISTYHQIPLTNDSISLSDSDGNNIANPDINDIDVSSVRYQIPIGYAYRLYATEGFGPTPNYIDLVGQGQIEQIDQLSEYDFNDKTLSSSYCANSNGGVNLISDYPPPCIPINKFMAQYFEGITDTLSINDVPSFQQEEDYPIHKIWGLDSPYGLTVEDNFSVRWTGWISFTETVYEFTTTADDGVRVFIDGEKIIDDWEPHPPQTSTGLYFFENPGLHEVVIEYFEAEGDARVDVNWEPKYGIVRLDTDPHEYIGSDSGKRDFVKLFDGAWEWENGENTALMLLEEDTALSIIMEFEELVALSGFQVSVAGYIVNASHIWSVAQGYTWDSPSLSTPFYQVEIDQEGLVQIDFGTDRISKVFKITVERNNGDGVEHVLELIPIFGPDPITQVSPQGAVYTSPVTYSWQEAPDAASYRLLVDSDTTTVIDDSYDPAVICQSGICTATPPFNYPSGDYVWVIQALDESGTVISQSAPLTFTMACNNFVASGDVAELINNINAANNSGQPTVICLAANGTYNLSAPDNGFNGLPTITTDITIIGNQATIARTGTGEYRFFEVMPAGTLTLDSISLVNGFVQGVEKGGAIKNNQGQLSILNSEITGNTAIYGGAIYNDGGGVGITDSNISANTAIIGGAVVNNGTGSTLDILNSVLSQNTTNYYGGAVYNEGGSVNILESELNTNQASLYGGAIYQLADDSLLHLQAISLAENTAVHAGGAIYIGGGTATILESQLRANTVTGEGSAIYHVPTTCCNNALQIFDSLIQDNIAIQDGGTIYSAAPLSIKNSTIANNTSPGGAAVWSEGETIIANSTISGNETDSAYGVLYNLQDSMVISNTTIAENVTPGIDQATIVMDAPVSFVNTIVANVYNCSSANPSLTNVSHGHNLENQDTCDFNNTGDLVNTEPILGSLQDNGGSTPTHALLSGSPAIDSGDNANCLSTDQRWIIRPADGLNDGQAQCDIGAYEFVYDQTPTQGVINDADTSLLLYFNQFPHLFIGADGEFPLSTGYITIRMEDGLFGEAAFFPYSVNELNYYSEDNIDEQTGTLDFWIQPEWDGDDNLDHTIMRYGYWGGIIFSKDASNNLRGVWNRFANGGQPEVNVETDISHWAAGDWHHIAYTWDENNARLYIDGVLQNETAVTTPLPLISDTTFQIGGDGTASNLGAKLDDFRISSRVRTTAEINAVYLFGSQYLNQENLPPSPAANPTPADGAVDWPLDAILAWDAAADPDDDPVTYDVYLGLDPNALQNISADQTGETFDPENFSYNTTYYWRVDAKDDLDHVTVGSVWSFTTEALPANILPKGYYEETDPRFTYNGASPWLYWQGATASRNSIFYTSEPGASMTFQIYGNGLTIYRYIQWNGGNMEVCIDEECTTVSNYHATASYPQSPVSFTGLEFGVHTVEIENASTAVLSIDAIKVLNPQPLGTGIHEDNDPNLVYSGRWKEWIEYGKLSQLTAQYVNQSGSTVEFQIDGDEMIVYRTTSPNWSNMEVCIDNNPCAVVSNHSAATLYRQPAAFSNLGAGIHNVVIRTTSAGTVDIDAIEINKTAAPLQTGLHQETSQQINQTGNWLSYTSTNTNGGTEIYTYDQTAELTFSVEGEQFVLYRLVGPNLDAAEICIDSVCANYGNFNPTHLAKQPLVIDDLGPGIHDIVIRKANLQPDNYIAVDAILIPEPLTVGLHQENDINFIYRGNWVNWTYTAYYEAEKYTSDNSARVGFSFIGDGIIIYRPTNHDRTMMTVCIDNAICKTGSGYSTSAIWDVPISFTNLGMGLHTVDVYPATSSPFDPVSIDFDAVEILAPTTPLTPGQSYNTDNNAYFVHHGWWYDTASTYTVGGDWHYNNVIGSEINFRVEGDELIVYVTKAEWAGIILVCVDGNCQSFDLYSPSTQYQVPLSLPDLGEGVHEVKISNYSHSIFTSNIWVGVEAVEVLSSN